MNCHQAHDRMSMPGQHHVFTGLRPTDKVSQTRFCIGYGKLHGVLLFSPMEYGPDSGPIQALDDASFILRLLRLQI